MNEVIKNIKTRRSTRAFKADQIPEDKLNAIIEAGLYAPSAMNEQSWHLTVVQNKDIVDKISDSIKKVYASSPDPNFQARGNNDKYHVFYNAPCIIIISGNENSRLPQCDCDAATQNILLAANSLDIASCWIGSAPFFFPTEVGAAMKKELNIPEEYKPLNMVALGYAAMDAKAPERKEGTVNYIK